MRRLPVLLPRCCFLVYSLSNMNRNFCDYLIEYTDQDGMIWTHAEKECLGDAISMLKVCRDKMPKYKWHITKKHVTFKKVLVTPKCREIEV